MYFFHRMLFPIMIRIMVIGMVSIAIAAPMPEGNPLMSSNGRGLDTIKQQSSITFNHSKDSLDQGCWNRPSQGGDGYSIALNEPYEAGCSSMVGV